MNYLVHLYLSDPTPHCLIGNLMGDFIKGPIDDRVPTRFRPGVRLHRQVDVFAHQNLHFLSSKRRIDDSFRYFKPVLVDIFYDHFLARNWSLFSNLPLEEFADRVYRLLEAEHHALPPNLQAVAPRMIQNNWLVSYRNEKIIDRVFERLAQRLPRSNPLARGGEELRRHYGDLDDDFRKFLAEAEAFVAGLARKERGDV